MPDFAGIALVDILANGVAVLIIVIVITIAVRSEHDKQLGEQAREVATVMTREFSTSLVLNRLAASPPAVLHDYERSPMDAIWDPFVLPILEIHRDMVRDPYSGETWSRSELLKEPNGLDDFLRDFTANMKSTMRIDMYDVGTFYLAMSILREHGIVPRHWHFVGASIGTVAAASCPPGVPAKDCAGSASGGTSARSLLALQEALEKGESPSGADNGRDEGWDWGGEDDSSKNGNTGSSQSGSGLGNQMPGGIALGSSRLGSASESFPGFRPDGGSATGTNNGNEGSSLLAPGGSATLRLALPGTVQGQQSGGFPIGSETDLEDMLAALLLYLRHLQEIIDHGEPLQQELLNWQAQLRSFFERTDQLSEDERAVVEYLANTYDLLAQQGGITQGSEGLSIGIAPPQETSEMFLRLLPNRPLLDADIGPRSGQILEPFPSQARVRLNLNAYPGVWQGLRVDADEGSVLLMPPKQSDIETPKWRSVLYLSPILDDLIVGFIYGTFDEAGRLLAFVDTNSVQVGNQQITNPVETGWFHVKSWLVVLYFSVGGCLLLLLFFWNPRPRTDP